MEFKIEPYIWIRNMSLTIICIMEFVILFWIFKKYNIKLVVINKKAPFYVIKQTFWWYRMHNASPKLFRSWRFRTTQCLNNPASTESTLSVKKCSLQIVQWNDMVNTCFSVNAKPLNFPRFTLTSLQNLLTG